MTSVYMNGNIFNEEEKYLNKNDSIYVDEYIDTRSSRQYEMACNKKDRCKKMWVAKKENIFSVCADRVAKNIMKKKHVKGWMKDNIL